MLKEVRYQPWKFSPEITMGKEVPSLGRVLLMIIEHACRISSQVELLLTVTGLTNPKVQNQANDPNPEQELDKAPKSRPAAAIDRLAARLVRPGAGVR